MNILKQDALRLVGVAGIFLCGALSADDSLQIAELGACPLESGEEIKDCRVGYRVLGQLNDERSNVIVFPSWYGGSSEDLVKYGYVGPGKMADTDRYYVIVVDALANGVSSSPSNSTQQAMGDFPEITIGDMVSSQHQLLTEHLEIDHVYAVMGVSLGGMQTLEWMFAYPDFMDLSISVEGTPWPSSYDLLLWGSWLEAEAVYDGSEESLARASRLLAQLDGLTLWNPEYFGDMVSAQDFPAFMQGFTPLHSPESLQDRSAQTVAVLSHDVRRNIPDFETRVADVVKSELMVAVFSQDHMVNPESSLELADMLDASAAVWDTSCGHMASNPDCVQAEISRSIHLFMAENPPRSD